MAANSLRSHSGLFHFGPIAGRLPRVDIRTEPVPCFARLGREWRALEADVAGLSFFQSWSWVGCLAEQRYRDPVLIRALDGGRTIGLALFNRSARRLCLAESGDPDLDAPFIEHNAPLAAGPRATDVQAALLRAAWGTPKVGRLVLSGVAPRLLGDAGGRAWRVQERPAPLVDLDAVRAAGGDWLATRSANTRYTLRRSMRAYEARGPLRLDAARDAAEALDWFDALLRLHTRTWQDRGLAGAFATPFLLGFHRALIATTAARGELDLLRVTAAGQDVGYLYNFRLGGWVNAYQSGLDHAGAATHGKPGLTCHALAIARALGAGARVYDFLAGAAQYKASLATGTVPLVWAELVPTLSAPGLVAALRRFVAHPTLRGHPVEPSPRG